jgi:PAS domain S-box-containing protein
LDGRVIDVNETFVKRLDYKKEDVVGKHVLDFVVSEHRREVLNLLEMDFRGEYTHEAEIGIYARDGSVHTLLFAPGVVVLYENGEPYAVLASGVDISEHLRAKKAIEELKCTKDNLTNLIVHDIKNLTSAMAAWSEMLYDGVLGPVTEAQMDALRRITGSNEELYNLSEEILDIAMSEEGLFTLEKEPYPLEEQVDELVKYYGPYAVKDGRKLTFDYSDRPILILADKARIKRVVANLIDNALKFTLPVYGKVFVRVSKIEKGGVATVEVSDNGPGVPEEFRDRIFEKFYRADSGKSGAKNGKGLGLAFCKMIVEAHGGKIVVENGTREGSVFRFTIPLFNPDRRI